jgi:hypothetical protein
MFISSMRMTLTPFGARLSLLRLEKTWAGEVSEATEEGGIGGALVAGLETALCTVKN